MPREHAVDNSVSYDGGLAGRERGSVVQVISCLPQLLRSRVLPPSRAYLYRVLLRHL